MNGSIHPATYLYPAEAQISPQRGRLDLQIKGTDPVWEDCRYSKNKGKAKQVMFNHLRPHMIASASLKSWAVQDRR
jgi:hypothetical protein